MENTVRASGVIKSSTLSGWGGGGLERKKEIVRLEDYVVCIRFKRIWKLLTFDRF